MSTEKQAATQERVVAALDGISGLEVDAVGTGHDGMVTVTATADTLHAICQRLRDDAGFCSNTLVTARDHGAGREERFEMFYQLLSIDHADRVRVRLMTSGDEPEVASVSELWPGARFSERETFDMFGIRFDGLADHRRLLMPQGYDHFPLRKDFPHVGIEPDRLYRQWDEERRAEFEAEEAARKEG